MRRNLLTPCRSALMLFLPILALQANAQNREETVPEIVKNSLDAVVLIVIADSTGKDTALGSGFMVSSDGQIVTNYHVIRGAHSAIAKLANGALFLVDGVLGVDVDNDLAVLKVSGKDLPFLKLADSGTLQIGEHVVAIGSPLGLQNTVSDGIVSGIPEVAPNRKLIQTTTPVSSGNSGGPLLNSEGSVVGVINASIRQGQNLNFAVPINQVKSLLSGTSKLISLEAVTTKEPASTEKPHANPTVRSVQEILADAKTIFVWVRSGSPVLGAEISKKLLAWGKLSLLTSPQDADLVLEVVQVGELNLQTGAGNQASAVLKDYRSGLQLWTTTKGGSWAMSGYSNAWVGRAIASDLTKFLNSTGKSKKH
jgi:S1-C subfamily serine protease